jgi:methionine synthase II (cobalamin-independent)
MEKNKVSKKALQSLLNDSMRDAIGHLELPKPTKKVKKLLDRSSKKLATEFAQILRKESRKAKKAEKALTYVDEMLAGKKNKKGKQSKLQAVEAA